MLKHSIEGDWEAREKSDGDELFNLAGGAKVKNYQEKEDGVAKDVVGAVNSSE